MHASLSINTLCFPAAQAAQHVAMVGALGATALVEVSDYCHGDRGLPCRAVPGDGVIPLARMVPAIMGAGFRGYFDLEIIGPRLNAEGAEQGLLRAGAYMNKLLEDAGRPGVDGGTQTPPP
jgi:hypothetical protein